ncbi:MAG: coproporphyrinogen-III oxidase family protein [Acidimicrobiales bacterium]
MPAPPFAIEHLYVHVPFCPTICPFCSFHVLRRGEDLVRAYLRRLDRELADTAEAWASVHPQRPLRSIYLGGGTPSHLHDDELAELLDAVRRRFPLAADAELGLEAHPHNVAPDRPRRWRELGFNRVSVGVQSTQDHVLRRLGRRHDAASALAALDAVLEIDGWTVNADLIVAAPGQDVAADLHAVAGRGVHHLAAYTLTIEPGTPFERRGVQVDEEDERAALVAAGDLLPAYGLHRYEVSNHARAGRQCTHNLAYWRGAHWFGVGPSATASLPTPLPGHHGARPVESAGVAPGNRAGAAATGVRALCRNPDLDAWLRGEPPTVEILDATEVARTRLLTGLRLAEGVERAVLHRAIGGDDPEAPARLVDELRTLGWLELRGERLHATRSGLLVLDRLLARLW